MTHIKSHIANPYLNTRVIIALLPIIKMGHHTRRARNQRAHATDSADTHVGSHIATAYERPHHHRCDINPWCGAIVWYCERVTPIPYTCARTSQSSAISYVGFVYYFCEFVCLCGARAATANVRDACDTTAIGCNSIQQRIDRA